jgi:hypothetical protein
MADAMAWVPSPPQRPAPAALALGTGAWALFACHLHARRIGVAPLG